jgi:hypothetical protein
MFTDNFKWSARISTIIVCIMVSTSNGDSISPYSISPRDATPLDINLVRIVNQDKGKGTDIQKLEENCLELLKEHNSPEDKGKIYTNIAFMYSSRGYSSPNDIRIAKTAEYCSKALEYPLDFITTCEMYLSLSGSQITPYRDSPQAEFAKARKESIVTCLKGLKLVLDNNAPKEWKEQQVHRPPIVLTHDGPPNDPSYKKRLKEVTKYNEELIEENKKEKLEQRLYILRRAGIESCAGLYSYKSPYDTNELEKYAREILKGHDDTVDEIMARTRQLIPQQGNK